MELCSLPSSGLEKRFAAQRHEDNAPPPLSVPVS